MIKVLSGEFKGRKLNKINLDSIRPTQAKVKKSIMDSIRDFDSKIVLDLFSGSGSLGIESISRGAKEVCFVENDIKAVRILKENIDMLQLNSRCEIVKSDVFIFLKSNNKKYDLIFADPPYGKYDFEDIFAFIPDLLSPRGIFCYEDKKKNLEVDEKVKMKYYGNTQVVFWRK